MGATTPNLGLYKPGGGSSGLITPDETADIDRLNDNFDVIDGFAGTTNGRVTSLELTRTQTNRHYALPAADRTGLTGLKRGDTFQETDGDFLFFEHNGTAWKNRTRARAQLISSTPSIDGTVQLNWAGAGAGFVYQEGGKFWENTPSPLDILIPYTGRYRIYYTYRAALTAPLTVTVLKNGATLGNPAASSDVGAAGASSQAQRRFDVELLSTDKLRVSVVSTGAGGVGSQGLISIEYLGEV